MWWLRERNRKRGGGEERQKKYLTLLMSRDTNTRERDRKPGQHQFLKIILQASYSPSLNQKTFRELWTSHTEITLSWVFSYNQELLPTSYILAWLPKCISAGGVEEEGNLARVSTKWRKKTAREGNKWEIGGGEDWSDFWVLVVWFGLFFRLSCETETSALMKLCFRLQYYFKKSRIF